MNVDLSHTFMSSTSFFQKILKEFNGEACFIDEHFAVEREVLIRVK